MDRGLVNGDHAVTRPTYHLLGFHHTTKNDDYCACAYTAKTLKLALIFNRGGEHVLHYGNEGSVVPCEHVDIFSASEMAEHFGEHDSQRQYGVSIAFDATRPYWQAWNACAVEALKTRVQPGDFILTLAGTAQQPISDAFAGSAGHGPVRMVEYGIGYTGTPLPLARLRERNASRVGPGAGQPRHRRLG